MSSLRFGKTLEITDQARSRVTAALNGSVSRTWVENNSQLSNRVLSFTAQLRYLKRIGSCTEYGRCARTLSFFRSSPLYPVFMSTRIATPYPPVRHYPGDTAS